jgi:hypothetical protein
MMFGALFAREVYIRLAEDRTGFVSTVRRGVFPAKSTEFAVESRPATAPAEEPLSTRAMSRVSLTLLRLSRFGAPNSID